MDEAKNIKLKLYHMAKKSSIKKLVCDDIIVTDGSGPFQFQFTNYMLVHAHIFIHKALNLFKKIKSDGVDWFYAKSIDQLDFLCIEN